MHRAHLRRTHQRAGRERGGEQIEGVLALCQAAFHAADDMHHVTVAFDGAIGIDLHRARRGDAAKIVAREVHEHHVLGVFFVIGEQRASWADLPHRSAPRGRVPAMGRSDAFPP